MFITSIKNSQIQSNNTLESTSFNILTKKATPIAFFKLVSSVIGSVQTKVKGGFY